jgi:hypothetical protein
MPVTGSPAPSAAGPLRLWPLLVVVAGVLAGLVTALVVEQGWRPGCILIGIALLLGALERLVLPANAAGLLQVRGKAFDTAVLTLTGGAVLILTLVVPGGR